MRIPERFVGARDVGSIAIDESDDLGAIAIFFDFENIVLGVKEGFRVSNVINALNERGEVMIRRAYADWGRYRRHQRQFLEAGVNMVFLPSYGVGDKNRTDTAICVDAMEILFQRPHIDTFVIVSGDSDFGVLAHRLRDHAKRIVGISAKSAASDILVRICHEFIFYETMVGQRVQGYSVEEGETRVKKALKAVVDQHGSKFRASVLKDRMRKQDPTFSEKNYGATSFTRFLSNYEHLLDVLDGGMVQVTWDTLTGATGGGGDSRGDGQPKQPPKLAPEMEAEARSVLTRAICEASKDGDSVSLSRLKDTMQEVAPDFDELGLGFRTFTRFLKAFPDIVVVERNRNRAHPAEGVAESAPEPKPEGRREERKKTEDKKPEPAKRAEDEGAGEVARDEVKEAVEEPEAEEKKPSEDKESPGLSRAERRRIRAANRPKPPTPVAKDEEAEEKSAAGEEAPAEEKAEEAPKKRSRRSRSSRKGAAEKKAAEEAGEKTPSDEEAPKKKTASKRSSTSGAKTAAKKSTSKSKSTAKKSAADAEEAGEEKKSAAKKPAAKKSTSRSKSTAKKSTAKDAKAEGDEPAAKKSTAKKSTTSKSKTAAKKSTAKKPTASKSKSTAKKSTAKPKAEKVD